MTTRAALRLQRGALVAVGALLAAMIALPLLALALGTPPAELRQGLGHPMVWPALRLSLGTSTASMAIVVALGTPLAWVLANARGAVARGVETLLQLPIVLPPAVAGVALLLAFGRNGPLAGWLYPPDGSIAFTTMAVVLAQVFVAAPFHLQSAVSAFRRIDPGVLIVARSLGASPWRVLARIAIPIAAPGIVAGAALAWARALGEFGATLMFAGNLRGVTQTMPLAIYAALEEDVRVAQALSLVLMAAAFVLLVVVRRLTGADRLAGASGAP